MDEFELAFGVSFYGSGVNVKPVGNLSLLTSKCRKYELPYRDCTSSDKVYCFLHAALSGHRPNGEAKRYYSWQDEAEVWR